MPILITDDLIRLDGDCGVEDAEALAAAFAAAPNAHVDMGSCRQLHGAVVQALLVFRPLIAGRPEDAFLNAFVLPALMGHGAAEPGLPPDPRVQGQ